MGLFGPAGSDSSRLRWDTRAVLGVGNDVLELLLGRFVPSPSECRYPLFGWRGHRCLDLPASSANSMIPVLWLLQWVMAAWSGVAYLNRISPYFSVVLPDSVLTNPHAVVYSGTCTLFAALGPCAHRAYPIGFFLHKVRGPGPAA